jgi:hypothetical protein
MSRRPPISPRGAQKLGERERAVGLETDDDAAKWLAEHDPAPLPATPKAAHKNKQLHRWRQQQARGGR